MPIRHKGKATGNPWLFLCAEYGLFRHLSVYFTAQSRVKAELCLTKEEALSMATFVVDSLARLRDVLDSGEYPASATIERHGDSSDLPVIIGQHGSRAWLFGHEFGATRLIIADSFNDAWEEMLDDAKAIEASEVPEAYGLESEAEIDAIEAFTRNDGSDPTREQYSLVEAILKRGSCNWDGVNNPGDNPFSIVDFPCLLEGYEYKPNFGNSTGIVDVGHYAWLRAVDESDFVDGGLRVTFEADESDD